MLGKKLHVKKGDNVMVIVGKDKHKIGKVLRLVPKKDRVLIEGLNIVKRHTRAKGNEAGGVVEKEAPIHISNVMVYCGKCMKAVRTRISVHEDKAKERLCTKCGESFDNN